MFQPLLNFLYHISPAIVTVLLGALCVQLFFVSRANASAFIDYLIKELETLRADSLEYWNLAGDTDDAKSKQQVLTQKIKGSIKSLTSDLIYFSKRYCKKQESQFSKLMMEVSDACTNGEFESTTKPIDRGRYLLVINAINHVKSDLLQRKL